MSAATGEIPRIDHPSAQPLITPAFVLAWLVNFSQYLVFYLLVTTMALYAVREFAAGKLAHYKVPRYVRVMDEFPMTVTGKVRKVEMREAAAQILRRDGA